MVLGTTPAFSTSSRMARAFSNRLNCSSVDDMSSITLPSLFRRWVLFMGSSVWPTICRASGMALCFIAALNNTPQKFASVFSLFCSTINRISKAFLRRSALMRSWTS